MKAKIRATDEIIEVERITNNLYGRIDGIATLYKKDMLDFNINPTYPEATVSGWICKEKDGELLISSDKPVKNIVDDGTIAGSIEWTSRGFVSTAIYSAFPALTWEDDPIEVEITIKPKKQ